MPTGVYPRTKFHSDKMKEGFAKIRNNPDWCEKQRVRHLGKKHSLETRLQMSEAQSGEKNPWFGKFGELHPRWIKDRTTVVKSEHKHLDTRYLEWMFAVKRRDNWKCRIINSVCSGRLEAHHILNWQDFPELRYELTNGITLCHAHHPRGRENEAKLSSYFQEMVADR